MPLTLSGFSEFRERPVGPMHFCFLLYSQVKNQRLFGLSVFRITEMNRHILATMVWVFLCSFYLFQTLVMLCVWQQKGVIAGATVLSALMFFPRVYPACLPLYPTPQKLLASMPWPERQMAHNMWAHEKWSPFWKCNQSTLFCSVGREIF